MGLSDPFALELQSAVAAGKDPSRIKVLCYGGRPKDFARRMRCRHGHNLSEVWKTYELDGQ